MRLRAPRPVLITTAALAVLLGAAPAFAQTEAQIDAKAQALHHNILVLDSHADLPPDFATTNLATETTGQIDLPKLRRGGVDAAVLAVFVQQGARTPDKIAEAQAQAQAKLAVIQKLAADNPQTASLARTAAEVEQLHAAGKTAIIIGFLNAYPFGKETAPIDDYYKAGVRVFGFTHAGNNDYADSSRPSGEPKTEWNGLSPVGQAAVEKLNRLGVIVDISQLTPDGVFQVLKLTKAPVVASHSGVKGKVDVTRNLSDAELDAIKANGGVVQVVAFKSYLVGLPADYDQKVKAIRGQYGLPGEFRAPADGAEALPEDRRAAYNAAIAALRRPATVVDLVDSIDYVVKRIGVDHVGVGSDFNHNSGIVGYNDSSEALNVTRELVRRGYSDADIAKIWGGNFLRVFKAVEVTAKRIGA